MPRGRNVTFLIYNVVRRIPYGRVASYGQVAALAGMPRAAQVVGWSLGRLKPNTKLPWHRVVNKDGIITIENLSYPKEAQAALLESEGIVVERHGGVLVIDLKKFGWNATL